MGARGRTGGAPSARSPRAAAWVWGRMPGTPGRPRQVHSRPARGLPPQDLPASAALRVGRPPRFTLPDPGRHRRNQGAVPGPQRRRGAERRLRSRAVQVPPWHPSPDPCKVRSCRAGHPELAGRPSPRLASRAPRAASRDRAEVRPSGAGLGPVGRLAAPAAARAPARPPAPCSPSRAPLPAERSRASRAEHSCLRGGLYGAPAHCSERPTGLPARPAVLQRWRGQPPAPQLLRGSDRTRAPLSSGPPRPPLFFVK